MAEKVVRRKNPTWIPKGDRSPVKINPVTGELEPAFVVRPPGWEQFIKIDPILGTSEEEKVAKRKALAIQISSSPTPEVAKNLAWLLTKIDDVQDGFVTLSVATRIAARFLPKVIPVAGWVATAADVLNLAEIVLRPWMVVAKMKNETEDAGKLVPDTYRRRLAKQVATGKLRVGWGEVFQILQTSANLVDVGIEIGAGFGYATDLAFGLIRGADIVFSAPRIATAEEVIITESQLLADHPRASGASLLRAVTKAPSPLHFRTFGALGYLDQVFEYPIGTFDTKVQDGARSLVEWAGLVGQAWADMGPMQDDLAFDQHLSALASWHMSQQVLKDVVQMFPYQAAVNYLYEETEIEAGPVMNPAIRELVRYHGQDPDDPRLPVPGLPRRMPYREYAVAQKEAWARAWRSWSKKAPTREASWFVGQLLDQVPGIQLQALEGDDVQTESVYTAEYQALVNMIESGITFGAEVDGETVGRVITALAGRLDPPEISKVTQGELVGLVEEVLGPGPGVE